jgi:hypothetical protein
MFFSSKTIYLNTFILNGLYLYINKYDFIKKIILIDFKIIKSLN